MRNKRVLILLGAAVALGAAAAQDPAFVPGSKTLLEDSFSELLQGALRQWKVEGSPKPGAGRGLVAAAETTLYPKIAAWPQSFTVEMEFTMVKSDDSDIEWFAGDQDGNQLWKIWVRFNDKDQSCVTHLEGDTVEYGVAEGKCAPGEAARFAFSYDKGRIRVFLNGRQALASSVRADRLGLVTLVLAPSEGGSISLDRVRIAQ